MKGGRWSGRAGVVKLRAGQFLGYRYVNLEATARAKARIELVHVGQLAEANTKETA